MEKLNYNIFIIFIACLLAIYSCKSNENDSSEIGINGDYILSTQIKSSSTIYFSGSKNYGYRAKIQITDSTIEVRRLNINTNEDQLLKRKSVKISYPQNVTILKNGNFFRFWIGSNTEWIRGPLGEWEYIYEPFFNEIQGYTADNEPLAFEIKNREWLSQSINEAIKYGIDGSFYEQQIIPGAILEYDNVYYLYFMAGMKGDEEGASRRTIGVAKSKNLIDWEVNPEPIITYKDYPYDNLYINGAALTPDNKIAIMFSAQGFPEWKGIMLAIADSPEGKFVKCEKQPVYKHGNSAHEFDLVDMKVPTFEYNGEKYRYMLFYAGFTDGTSRCKAGDKGYIIFSNNLTDWVYCESNPVFYPETIDNWDSSHVRPRSLNRIGDYWYLWYEGCNSWTPPGKETDVWCDVIGLARSKDLKNWEYHPRNPVLSGLGINDSLCGSSWVGWPRMIVKEKIAYVFFCGMHDKGKVSTTFRTIPLHDLIDWESDLK